jgi:hypothetical protein
MLSTDEISKIVALLDTLTGVHSELQAAYPASLIDADASPVPVVLMKTTAVTSWVSIGANYKYAAAGDSTEVSGIAG